MSENKREFFRVRFYLETVKIYPKYLGGCFEGSINDISAKGISFCLFGDDALPEEETSFNVEFKVEGSTFKKTAKVVRFKQDYENNSIFYAMQFVGDSEKDCSKLYQALMSSEAKRKL